MDIPALFHEISKIFFLPSTWGSKKLRILKKENYVLVSKADVLEDELRLLRHKIFGRRSERFSVEDLQQSSLFDETDYGVEEQVRKLSEPTVSMTACVYLGTNSTECQLQE